MGKKKIEEILGWSQRASLQQKSETQRPSAEEKDDRERTGTLVEGSRQTAAWHTVLPPETDYILFENHFGDPHWEKVYGVLPFGKGETEEI